jgi:hypothetical protein
LNNNSNNRRRFRSNYIWVGLSYVIISTLMIYFGNAELFFPNYAYAAPSTNATAPSNMTAAAPSTNATAPSNMTAAAPHMIIHKSTEGGLHEPVKSQTRLCIFSGVDICP